MRYALQYRRSHSVFFAVILRDDEDEDVVNGLALSRQYAMVLYNQAVACLLCQEYHRIYARALSSTTTSSRREDSSLLRVACHSLAKADSVMSSIQQDDHDCDAFPRSTHAHGGLGVELHFLRVSGLFLSPKD